MKNKLIKHMEQVYNDLSPAQHVFRVEIESNYYARGFVFRWDRDRQRYLLVPDRGIAAMARRARFCLTGK